jgi:crotonobetainyl-CoA:carnitine CoA-transferase CaiB-like acyl-CoA transferase
MRTLAPTWDAALNAGKESVVCDLKTDAALGRALCARADVVVEGFRPGVAARLGVGPDDVPESVVYCSITGFGTDGPHVARAGHDVNYLGWAGALADTAPGLPPVQVADLAGGALAAVAEILAALVARERSGRGSRLVVSMTHVSHRLVSHRLEGDPIARMLTGGLACYRIYGTADGRLLTVGALEPKFFRRLCELLGVPELAERQFDADQEPLALELARVVASRRLDEWLELFDGEDVCAGPVWSIEEAARAFGDGPPTQSVHALGQDTAAWRDQLGVSSPSS